MGSRDPLLDPDVSNVVVLKNDRGEYEVDDLERIGVDGRTKARKEAAKRKAVELHRVMGAALRVKLWPRKTTKSLAIASANRMMAMILMGEIEPKSAEEAARVAKMLDEIARREAGAPIVDENDDSNIVDGDARLASLQRAQQLRDELVKRVQDGQAQPAELLGGYVPDRAEDGLYDPDGPADDAEGA